jgi:hypothetical protein
VIGGPDGPAIGETANGPAGIDHQLDRKRNHPRLQQPRPWPAIMRDLRFLVELAADAVTTNSRTTEKPWLSAWR